MIKAMVEANGIPKPEPEKSPLRIAKKELSSDDEDRNLLAAYKDQNKAQADLIKRMMDPSGMMHPRLPAKEEVLSDDEDRNNS